MIARSNINIISIALSYDVRVHGTILPIATSHYSQDALPIIPLLVEEARKRQSENNITSSRSVGELRNTYTR